jgi:hypothetical protein
MDKVMEKVKPLEAELNTFRGITDKAATADLGEADTSH